jgi:hypothetical protein
MFERIQHDARAAPSVDDPREPRRRSDQPADERPRRLSRVWRTAGAVAAVAVVVGVVAVVVALVGHGPHNLDSTIKLNGQQTWGQRLRASRRALIAELAPLRRPQKAADRAIARTLNRHELPFEEFYGTPDRSLVRYAATTPWGQRLYLVPITPWTSEQVREHEGKHVHAPPPVEEFAVYAPGTSFNVGAGSAARSVPERLASRSGVRVVPSQA